MRDAEKTIGNIIDKQKTAFLGSVSEDGVPNVRANRALRSKSRYRFFSGVSNIRAKPCILQQSSPRQSGIGHAPNVRVNRAFRNREGIRTLYFTTNTGSLKVKQFTSDEKACVYFYDGRFYRGVMLTGRGEVMTDEKVKRAVWRDGDERYYREGAGDPDYCVLKFTAEKGRYYQNFKTESFTIDPAV